MRNIKINLEIANALVWAAILLTCSAMFSDYQNLFNFILAGSTLSFLWVDEFVYTRKTRCIKK